MSRIPAPGVKLPLSWLAFAVFTAIHSAALADDELSVQVSRDGAPAAGLSVVLDGETAIDVDASGLIFFDLERGQHSIQVNDGEDSLHSFRFSTARDQLADITIELRRDDAPSVVVQTYERTETAEDVSQAATGLVRGRVTNSGRPIGGASVELIGTRSRAVETAADGSFSIAAPRGIYTLVVSQDGMGSRSITDFRVVANAVIGNDVQLVGQDVASIAVLEEVVVVGSALVGGQQSTERFSTQIVDVLGYAEIARFGDSDIAASVLRVPAVTVEDGKYVFVRGLGGRYLSTDLNGATMPSTDPTKRTVPLDLFPSSMVNQLDINKTFIASSSGESTGGEIRIETRTFPTESVGSFGLSIGINGNVTGEDVWTDPLSGDYDFFGVDDGTRNRPVEVVAISAALDTQNVLPSGPVYGDDVAVELSKIAALALQDGLDPEIESAAPDLKLSFSYGDLVSINRLDADFGYYLTASLDNSWNLQEGVKARYQPGQDQSGNFILSPLEEFDFSKSENTVDLNALAALGFNRGRSSYESNTILARSTLESVERSVGVDLETGLVPAVSNLIEYEERQFLSQQLAGNHIFGEIDQWSIDWQASGSRAERYAPDRREVTFRREDGPDQPFVVLSPSISRRYDDLVDINWDLSTDIEYLFVNGAHEASLQLGAQAIDRERDSDSQTFGFDATVQATQSLRPAPNLDVNDAINESTITGDRDTGYAFIDDTQPSDSYEAEMTLNSVYASYDILFSQQFQLVIGARHEAYEQTTDTFSGDKDNPIPVFSVLDESSTLPSLTFNWLGLGDHQVRVSATQTVARPDFKETSNATFFDRELNVRVQGNPGLQISDVTNFDVRWEKYWSGQESISIAYFFKDLDDPIERIAVVTSGNVQTRTFVNAPSAEISGFEIDVRKEFAINDAFTRSLFVAANLSVLDSEVKLADAQTRSLQGAPDYSANLILGYDDINLGQEVTLLLNESGDTIIDVGTDGLPDIIREPHLSVDFNYHYDLSDALTFSFAVENLLDSDREFTQGGLVYRKFREGRTVAAGFDWNF